jgi:hypothetical protein
VPPPGSDFDRQLHIMHGATELGADGNAGAFRVTVKDGKVNLTAKSTRRK